MQTINTIKTFPTGTPIDAVQCRITKAYEHKPGTGQYGPYTVQKAVVEDAGGNKLDIEAWDHPDLARAEGQEVVIQQSSRGKGLEVKRETYTATKGPNAGKVVEKIFLKLGKYGTIQNVAVHHTPAAQTQGVAAPAVVPAAGPTSVVQVTGQSVTVVKNPDTTGPIHGATAGLATNKAIEILIAAGYDIVQMAKEGKLAEQIVSLGSQIALGALSLEKGVSVPPVKQIAPKAKETAPAVKPAPEPVADIPEDQIPF